MADGIGKIVLDFWAWGHLTDTMRCSIFRLSATTSHESQQIHAFDTKSKSSSLYFSDAIPPFPSWVTSNKGHGCRKHGMLYTNNPKEGLLRNHSRSVSYHTAQDGKYMPPGLRQKHGSWHRASLCPSQTPRPDYKSKKYGAPTERRGPSLSSISNPTKATAAKVPAYGPEGHWKGDPGKQEPEAGKKSVN
jgi:hypothetical protein